MSKTEPKAFTKSLSEYIVREPFSKALAKYIGRMSFLIAFGRMYNFLMNV